MCNMESPNELANEPVAPMATGRAYALTSSGRSSCGGKALPQPRDYKEITPMVCRIGMATNVAARVAELKRQGKVPHGAACSILETGLTYKEASDTETRERNLCGRHCQGQEGGGYASGRVWSVYRIDW